MTGGVAIDINRSIHLMGFEVSTMDHSTAIVPGVRKIAVLRANALGDFIFTLPALDALHRTYPTAELVLLALSWHQSFLAHRPGPVNRVIVTPPYQGVHVEPGSEENSAEQDAFFSAMKDERFDLAVQVHGGGRHSNPFVRRLNARVTIGSKTPDAAPLDRWIPYIRYHPEVLRMLEVVSLAGAEVMNDIEPHITVTAADLAESFRKVPETTKPLVTLHPGATDPERIWPAERFATVGDAMAATGAQIVITGTAGERDRVRAVAAGMRSDAWELDGRLSLSGLTGLLERSQLVVSNDTGPLHLATAVGTATVGIYWCFNFVTIGPMTQARHRSAISWRVACPVCGVDRARTTCEHHPSFVADIQTEEVITSALDLLTVEPARGMLADAAT
ncbi:MAG: glycosyltransferase family 9 protein [Ktedonobacterales bacterium]